MIYDISNYVPIYSDTEKEKIETIFVFKIYSLLNKRRYYDFNDFINRNLNYETFLKENKMDTVIKHFDKTGNTFNNVDYKNIINNINKFMNKQTMFSNMVNTNEVTNNYQKKLVFEHPHG